MGERLVQHLQPLIERYEGVEWAGCRGSAPHYGGYPCGQWSLWHTLTVRQRAARTGRPTQVLCCCQLAEIFGGITRKRGCLKPAPMSFDIFHKI